MKTEKELIERIEYAKQKEEEYWQYQQEAIKNQLWPQAEYVSKELDKLKYAISELEWVLSDEGFDSVTSSEKPSREADHSKT